MIGLSCTVYLMAGNRYVGSFLFCIGLFTICTFGLSLYTGMAGYVIRKENLAFLGIAWIGNLFGTILCSGIVSSAIPDIAHLSEQMVLLRLTQTTHKTAILSILCGVLMYIAVETYKSGIKHRVPPCLGILLCVPTFILCGFEHSVADMFYLSASGYLRQSVTHLAIVSIGNATGALIARNIMFRE